MNPTDEDVVAAGKALDEATMASIGVTLNSIRAALEAYTPRLIERLAKEAEGEFHAYCESGRSGLLTSPITANWLRSFKEPPLDR